MKKPTLLTLVTFLILSCSTPKPISESGNGIGVNQETSNPNSPNINKNGYKNYELVQILTVRGIDSTYTNELRFNGVHSALYTKKLMFDKFGKWDREIRIHDDRHPVLVWEKRKLLDNDDIVYSVAATGVESMKEMYASVMVFGVGNRDCLSQNITRKDSLISYFSNGIINLSSDKKFYDVYWKMVNENKKKK